MARKTSGIRVAWKKKVTIPKFIRDELDIKDGDYIKFKIISDTEVKFWKE